MSKVSSTRYLDSLPQWRGLNDNFELSAIKAVLKVLGNPQDSVKTVHITGTNGKGSVSAAISSILGQAGYAVGLTISPHLDRVNERIVIDGLPIEDGLLAQISNEVESATLKADVSLTFFEAITAMAFLAFREKRVDWGVIEAGLGGEKDATNVIKRPSVTAIVSVDYDHQEILGTTLPEIARTKAGIMRTGVPMVLGPVKNEVYEEVVKLCKKGRTPLFVYGDNFSVENLPESSFRFSDADGANIHFAPSLPGCHQLANLGVALKIASILKIPQEACKWGVEQLFWAGRLEVVDIDGKVFIFDCAHNPSGIESLCAFLREKGFRGLEICFGVTGVKDWKGMVRALLPYVSKWNLLHPDTPTAVKGEEVGSFLSGLGITSMDFGDDYEACASALKRSPEKSLICGSIYMLGPLRAKVIQARKPIWIKNE